MRLARHPVLWICLAVMTLSAAAYGAATIKETHDRVHRIEREACLTKVSCQTLLATLLRFASDTQKRAIIHSLPNIQERLRRQIDKPEPKQPEQPSPALPRSPGAPAPKPEPEPEPEPKPVPGPRGPAGPQGPPGEPAPLPETPTVPEPPVEPPELPPLPEPVCELVPSLCP